MIDASVIGEIGTIADLDHNSQIINLLHNYDNPTIFAQSLSSNGGAPAIVRIEDVQSDRFTASIKEPSASDDWHAKESFTYLVFEEGSWQLDNGARLEVGKLNTDLAKSKDWKNVNFSQDFASNPLLFSQVQTNNGNDFVHTRQKNIDTKGFQVAIQSEEARKNIRLPAETLGWLAISTGKGTWNGRQYQAGRTSNSVTEEWHAVSFTPQSQFSESPQFLASIATFNGSDPAGVRYQNLNKGGVQVKVQEDSSADLERDHKKEVVNFLAIDDSGLLTGVKIGGSEPPVEENSDPKHGKYGNGELLFKSGFEGNVNILPYGSNRHTIAGKDTTTNFSWEQDLPADKSHFEYLTGEESPNPYIDTRIEEVTGPNGKATNALYMGIKKDYPGDSFITRNEFSLFPSPDLKQGYISYWMKLQGDLEEIWPNDGANRMLMEWKEPNVGGGGGTNNYRFNLNIRRDNGQLYWYAEGQQVQPKRKTEWLVKNKDVPVPTDEWFKVEVFWRQGSKDNGRLWFAVNGEEVADYQGRTQHATRPQDLKFWSIFKLYPDRRSWFDNRPIEHYQWIDDVEIRES